MKIIRFGSTHGSPSRYIDLLKRKDIEKILWIARDNDIMVKSVFEECRKISPNLIEKMELVTFSVPLSIRYMSILLNRVSLHFPGYAKLLIYFKWIFELVLKGTNCSQITSIISADNYEFIWSGNNDSDGTNILLWWLRTHYHKIPVVHSYKEHRCRFQLDERMALESSSYLIVPSKRNKQSFEDTYKMDLSSKVVYGDEDWRYSGLIKYIDNLDIDKKSMRDGEPHVVILSMYASYGSKKDRRRGSRINYVDLSKALISRNVHVHLKCFKIVRSIEDQIYDEGNPYVQLSKEYPKYFHIDLPLNLKEWDGYRELKSFDAGILHNMVQGEKINLFSAMNVPNRLFEYIMCDVHPISIKGQMLDVEDILAELDFGIVGRNYDEIARILYSIISNKSKRLVQYEKKLMYSFERLVSIIMNLTARNI